ncbi:MAG: hypothetical protein ACLS9T_03065 [Streptococcus salivarius]
MAESAKVYVGLFGLSSIYLAYLDENIQSFEAKIQALKEGPQKKRTKGQIADAGSAEKLL